MAILLNRNAYGPNQQAFVGDDLLFASICIYVEDDANAEVAVRRCDIGYIDVIPVNDNGLRAFEPVAL